jgi:glycine oxidase
MKTKTYETVIVGGGVIGCSIAFQLAKRETSVLLLEKERIASQASSAAAGMLGAQAELMESRTLFELARTSRSLFPVVSAELKELSGIDIGLVRKGLLRIALTAEEADRLRKHISCQQSLGEQAEWLTARQALEMEPELSPNVLGAMYIPDDGQVVASDLTNAFARSAVALGAEIQEFADVEHLVVEKETVVGIKTKDGIIPCNQVVVAAGVGTESLLKPNGLHVPVYPVKGECYSVKTSKPLLEKTIYTDGCYLVPKRYGEIVVGATVKKHACDRKVTLGGISSLMQQAERLLPSIMQAEWNRAWSGMRPQTPHDLPYLGEHPRCKGLFIAAGHYRNGILLSPITGIIMADLVEGKTPRWDISAFAIPETVHSYTGV